MVADAKKPLTCQGLGSLLKREGGRREIAVARYPGLTTLDCERMPCFQAEDLENMAGIFCCLDDLVCIYHLHFLSGGKDLVSNSNINGLE